MAESTLRYRALDASGDMTVGAGEAGFLTGLDAIRQAIQTRLKLLRGEWWERPEDGLPLFEQMLGRPRTQAHKELMELLVTERIADTRRVESVGDVKSAFDGRAYTYTAKVQTEFGQTAVEVSY